jgi:2-dehydro-3-deoxy-D-arabinonate dehydratase
MKLCRFQRPGRKEACIGLVARGDVYDVTPKTRGGSLAVLLESENPAKELSRILANPPAPFCTWAELDRAAEPGRPHLLAPLTDQEVWAAGVTYLRSREARMEESAGGGSFYDRVYHAPRPELFFKANARRVSAPHAPVRIRCDSRWNVPEPELALWVNSQGTLAGFTIGNDMSSRDIEGENPLYLPQAKIYQGCCALGPVIVPCAATVDPLWLSLSIQLRITRGDSVCFEGCTSTAKMKRSFEDLITYLFREQEFPDGVILLTGTGLVPPDSFTLRSGDIVEITVPEIGTLRNPVA